MPNRCRTAVLPYCNSQELDAPSYFNPLEATVVADLVAALIAASWAGAADRMAAAHGGRGRGRAALSGIVGQQDIGVICTYRKQEEGEGEGEEEEEEEEEEEGDGLTAVVQQLAEMATLGLGCESSIYPDPTDLAAYYEQQAAYYSEEMPFRVQL
ncbi:hypothetical protein TSOC_007506 [Tetrabaena socialis]|uniref:Uncharacterized protein n=1 Tax=Tetrabaena socialis TaxID=47790 RepID=A0A2J8A0X8_9CHLO|nr:hypothetical protein TSOC_007506 [Tetrabaena socialis]|eukprot:PNH06155.1 hypothetical protein TSOC_007506 [Tetrabaena socialis]